MRDQENMTKKEDAKARLVGLGNNAQKMLGNVTGTVTDTVTGLVQTVRNKTTTPAPSENYEICKSHAQNSALHFDASVLY